jgi:hypothetical protein
MAAPRVRMTARLLQRELKLGAWSRRLAVFFVTLLVLGVALHRFGGLTTPTGVNLILVSLGGLAFALLLALLALTHIWFSGRRGAGEAGAAIFLVLLAFVLPLWYARSIVTLPPLNDIVTDSHAPLEFKKLAALRPADANPLRLRDQARMDLQREAYPDIKTMELERSAREAFDIVEQAVRRLGWEVAFSEAPVDEEGKLQIGQLEATDKTLIMGYADDILVRVSGGHTKALIDARSVSRYGLHDLGTNAERIRTLFSEVKTELEKGERIAPEEVEDPPAKAEPKKPDRKPAPRRRRDG